MNMNKVISIAAFAVGVFGPIDVQGTDGGGPEITCDTLNGDILIKKFH